jgi:hypothetical protein
LISTQKLTKICSEKYSSRFREVLQICSSRSAGRSREKCGFAPSVSFDLLQPMECSFRPPPTFLLAVFYIFKDTHARVIESIAGTSCHSSWPPTVTFPMDKRTFVDGRLTKRCPRKSLFSASVTWANMIATDPSWLSTCGFLKVYWSVDCKFESSRTTWSLTIHQDMTVRSRLCSCGFESLTYCSVVNLGGDGALDPLLQDNFKLARTNCALLRSRMDSALTTRSALSGRTPW